jgi:hypothetical protein
MGRWSKERLAEQLKFFGAKKIGFISCYAKKPRILMVNTKKIEYKVNASEVARQSHILSLYQNQLDRGLQNSHIGYMQMAVAQRQQQMGLMGGLVGMGLAQVQFGGIMARCCG